MFFFRQRLELVELERQVIENRRRVDRAKARLTHAQRDFVGKPINLLLPFTVGVLGGALALYRKPPGAGQDGARRTATDGVSLRSLFATAGTLWSATAALRESLRTARFEPPAPVAGPPSEEAATAAADAGISPSTAVDEARQPTRAHA